MLCSCHKSIIWCVLSHQVTPSAEREWFTPSGSGRDTIATTSPPIDQQQGRADLCPTFCPPLPPRLLGGEGRADHQPLLELMRDQLGTGATEANLITVITQAGYAAGLCFLIPAGDLYSRRRLVVSCMIMAAVMALVIACATSVYVVWAASLVMGACSVIPQFFMPIAGQYSQPRNKARNMGYVLSGLLVGILGARVVGGFVGQWPVVVFCPYFSFVLCRHICLLCSPLKVVLL